MTQYDTNIAIFDTMRYIVPTLIVHCIPGIFKLPK